MWWWHEQQVERERQDLSRVTFTTLQPLPVPVSGVVLGAKIWQQLDLSQEAIRLDCWFGWRIFRVGRAQATPVARLLKGHSVPEWAHICQSQSSTLTSPQSHISGDVVLKRKTERVCEWARERERETEPGGRISILESVCVPPSVCVRESARSCKCQLGFSAGRLG